MEACRSIALASDGGAVERAVLKPSDGREWPSFKTGLRDLISEAEFSEMRLDGPKFADDVAKIIAQVRHDTAAAAH